MKDLIERARVRAKWIRERPFNYNSGTTSELLEELADELERLTKGVAWTYPYQLGIVVAATRQIIEDDVDYDPLARPCEPGWCHARTGDVGEVIHIDDGHPTVAFLNSEGMP